MAGNHMDHHRDLAGALGAWRDLLGREHVLTDEASLAAAETATFRTAQRIPAIIRPGSREQVQGCLEVANRYHVPVYPVSRGKSWGWGSRVPAADGCVLMELYRLDRILDHDERLAYVTVEPGVTFGQLSRFLRERGSRLMVNAVASTPDASVIGNIMERGHGSTPYGDRFAHACNLEVVLPQGDCIHTGYGRFPDAHAAPLHRWGVGPSLDGLFTQSNLGVVTAMTVWLPPTPDFVQTCFFAIGDAAVLPSLVDALQRLKISGVLPASPVLINGQNALAGITQYPWGVSGSTPLPRAYIAHLRRAMPRAGHVLAPWSGHVGLYAADAEIGGAIRERVTRELSPHVEILVFHDGDGVHQRVSNPPVEVSSFQIPNPRRSLVAGVPPRRGSSTPYWRKRWPPGPSIDPDRDRCGIIWCAVAVPFVGVAVAEAAEMEAATLAEHGFEPILSITGIDERVAYVSAMITYDREIPGEDERAMACHDAMLHRLMARGYYPRRLGLQSMGSIPGSSDATDELLAELKRVIDPHGILAPGRYLGQPGAEPLDIDGDRT